MTSFSAKSGIDLLLVYMPLLGAAIGLTSSQVGILLGISSTGALLARAATPVFVKRVPPLRLTVIATAVAAACLLALAVSDDLPLMIVAMSVLGFALGLSQTTTIDWVVDLVEDTSKIRPRPAPGDQSPWPDRGAGGGRRGVGVARSSDRLRDAGGGDVRHRGAGLVSERRGPQSSAS